MNSPVLIRNASPIPLGGQCNHSVGPDVDKKNKGKKAVKEPNSLCVDNPDYNLNPAHYFFTVIPRLRDLVELEHNPSIINTLFSRVANQKYLSKCLYKQDDLVKQEMTVEFFYDFLIEAARMQASDSKKEILSPAEFQEFLKSQGFSFEPEFQEKVYSTFLELIEEIKRGIEAERAEELSRCEDFKEHFNDPSKLPADIEKYPKIKGWVKRTLLSFDVEDENSWPARFINEKTHEAAIEETHQAIKIISKQEKKLLEEIRAILLAWRADPNKKKSEPSEKVNDISSDLIDNEESTGAASSLEESPKVSINEDEDVLPGLFSDSGESEAAHVGSSKDDEGASSGGEVDVIPGLFNDSEESEIAHVDFSKDDGGVSSGGEVDVIPVFFDEKDDSDAANVSSPKESLRVVSDEENNAFLGHFSDGSTSDSSAPFQEVEKPYVPANRAPYDYSYSKAINSGSAERKLLEDKFSASEQQVIQDIIEEKFAPTIRVLATEYERHIFARFGDLPRLYRNFLNRLEMITEELNKGERALVYDLVMTIIDNSWKESALASTEVDAHNSQKGSAGRYIHDDNEIKAIMGLLHAIKLNTVPDGLEGKVLRDVFNNAFNRAHALPFPRMFFWKTSALTANNSIMAVPDDWAQSTVIWNGERFVVENGNQNFAIRVNLNKNIFIAGRGSHKGKLQTKFMNMQFAKELQAMKVAAEGDRTKYLIGALTLLHWLSSREFSETTYLPEIMNQTFDALSEPQNDDSDFCVTLAKAMSNLLNNQKARPQKMRAGVVIKGLMPYIDSVVENLDGKKKEYENLNPFHRVFHRLAVSSIYSAIDVLIDRHDTFKGKEASEVS